MLDFPNEEKKHAAAFALGNVAVGNLSKCMPTILESIKAGGKRRYLVLVSLKEVSINPTFCFF